MSSRPLTVVHVQKFAGIAGSEGHLQQLLTAFDHNRVRSTLFMLGGNPTRREARYAKRLEEAGVGVRRLRLRTDFDPVLIAALARHFGRSSPDIVHTHLVHADLHAGIAARLARVPVLMSTKHNDDRFRRWWPMTWVERGVVAMADHTVATSDAIRTFHLDATGGDPARVTTILYGFESRDTPSNAASAANVRIELGIPTEAPIILSVGRLVDQKGHDVLLRAFAAMRPAGVAPFVVIAGDGPRRGRLEQLARELGLEPRVRFAGWRDDAARLMTAATVLAHPARWEGFGLVLLEAMAARLPIVASSVSAIPEVIGPDDAGILVPPDDPPALGAALEGLLADPSTRRRLVERASLRLIERFSPARMADEHEQLYRRCLATRAFGGPSNHNGMAT